MINVSFEQAMTAAIQHHQAGRLPEAEQIYRQILAQQPDHPDALQNLGVLAAQTNHPDAAIQLLRQSLTIRPDCTDAYLNLAQVLMGAGRADEAMAAFEACTKLQPANADLTHNVATFLHRNGRVEQAMRFYRKTLELMPTHADAYSNMGLGLGDLGRFDEAVAALDQALKLKPDHAGAHANRALMQLLLGRYEDGWREYEWRWKSEGFPTHAALEHPRWHGEPLQGRTLLVLGEQGAGDTIQFVRYAPLIRERGGRVIVACVPDLVRLLAQVEGVDQCVARDGPLPYFDVQCPMMSLPLIFQTTLEHLPAPQAYLTAPASAIEAWRPRVAGLPGLKVGLVWAGNPKHRNDYVRSMPLELLAPLCDVPGVSLVSLQKRDPTRAAGPLPAGLRLADWTERLGDFVDTAGLIANLDLVITVDTSVAHLAAAMGKPTWMMLQYSPDWRWLLGRSDNPWYPSVRLFRQRQRLQWEPVAAEVKAALAAKAAETRTASA